jgi:NDP-sugar pyrophosphorylase family protein
VKALVLAGGLGTRLRPRFGDLPKVLVPVGERPWIDRQLEWLASRGIRRAVLCVGHGADQVEAHVGDGSRWGLRVEWSREPEPLGTAGALALAAPFVDGAVLVMNGDTLADCDPWELLRAAWEHGALGAIALFPVEDARSLGRVEFESSGRIDRFVEKDPSHRGRAWVSGGLYVVYPALWRRLPPRFPASLERDVFPALAAEGRLWGLRCEARFYDIGTPESWEAAERRFAEVR